MKLSKKIVTLFVLSILLLSNYVSVSALETVNRDYSVVQQELEKVKEEFSSISDYNLSEEDFKLKSELNDKIMDLTSELIKLDWKVYYSEKNLFTNKSSINWYNNFETWDILLFNYWTPPFHSVFSWRWTHAAIIYDQNNIVEAPWHWDISVKRDLNDYFYEKAGSIKEIMVVKVWRLYSHLKEYIKSYIDKKLIWKPYPWLHQLAFSKYSMSTFYCSSLVWRAHASSWRFVDLDDNRDNFVWPSELWTSVNRWSAYIYSL